MINRKILLLSVPPLVGLVLFIATLPTHGAGFASLSVGPASGTYIVGSTFTASVYLDTGGEAINALDIKILFPPDKLQVVSPSLGKSIVSVWASQPAYNNKTGEISFEGGIPNPGINASQGIVSTITFRVKSIGRGVIKFSDEAKVFLNDGLATEILGNANPAIYDFVLPPPEGPIVSSPTHPDQSNWYSAKTVILNFALEDAVPVHGYSYLLSEEPLEPVDDISEGLDHSVTYRDLESGTYYFHIKALQDETWGGVTRFAINTDTAPPAEFKIDISPEAKTVRRNPIIAFTTTDANSGLEHYEIKLVSLSLMAEAAEHPSQPLFIETGSPYIPNLNLGKYDVIVRAYDHAGNYRESVARLEIVQALFQFLGKDGIRIRSGLVISWYWLIPILFLILVVLAFVFRHMRKWHSQVSGQLTVGALKDPVISARLDLLKEKQNEYSKKLALLIAAGLSLSLFASVEARSTAEPLSPPIIETVSRNVSNDELFYAGGKSDATEGEVVVYLQNLRSGETFALKSPVDQSGDWFYSHDQFLQSGRYLIWSQSRLGEELSPPSPQIELIVTETALQFGSSRLSYELVYASVALGLLVAILLISVYIAAAYRRGRKLKIRLEAEIREAEDSLRRGFALIARDIETELDLVRHTSLGNVFKVKEAEREKKLLKDLEEVKVHLSGEIWKISRDIERIDLR